jgi:hypothetical protein
MGRRTTESGLESNKSAHASKASKVTVLGGADKFNLAGFA